MGVINSSGQAVFFQTSDPTPGDVLVLPTITGTCSFSGTALAYGTPASGGGSDSGTVQGTVSSDESITATIASGNNLSLSSASPEKGLITALSSGGWNGQVEGSTNADLWDLEFTPTGENASMSVSGTNHQGCSIEGTFNQEGGDASALNVFDVSLNFVLDNCPYTSISGLGFESSTDYFDLDGGRAGTYLYAVSSDSAFVLEIYFVGD